MIKNFFLRLYYGRWIIATIVVVFVVAGGVYVLNENRQAVAAASDARDAARDADLSARAASASASSSADAAFQAKAAPCKAVAQVADVVNPFHRQFKALIDFFLKDRAQAIERARLAVENATTPAQKKVALLAQRQLKESLARFVALDHVAKQVQPLSC